jgi:hypothetical protein
VQADSNANGRRAVNRYLYPPVSEGTAAEKAEEESEGIIVDDCNRRSGRPSQALGRLLLGHLLLGHLLLGLDAAAAEEAGDVP